MYNDLLIFKNLKNKGFKKINIDQVFNYLETLEYELKHTKYVGEIIAKNERLAKYFFLRDKLKIEINLSDETFHIHEVLDQCIDWSEFWRLLVVKKGFCCIKLSGDSASKFRFIFFSGPNILSSSSSDSSNSIYEDMNY